MKLTTIVAVAGVVMSTAMSLQGSSAGPNASVPGRPVVVYISTNNRVPNDIEIGAQRLASEIFADIGVNIVWRFGSPSHPQAGAIVIETVDDPPTSFRPGALAYALPYEGVHIRVFWNRIKVYSYARQVLGHVMVHEITHILQGESRHSETGIMKAVWTTEDSNSMREAPLHFAPEDVKLIFEGLNRREAAVDRPAASDKSDLTAASMKLAAK